MIEKLSIIVPCYNEARTIATVYARLQALDVGKEKEIIIVDDASTDGSREWLMKQAATADSTDTGADSRTITLFHTQNRGKGSCIQTALKRATGDYAIVQDADIEYNPSWIPSLLAHAEALKAPAVYGSRASTIRNRVSSRFFASGVRGLTWVFNILYRQKITDLETCYKLVDTALLKSLGITEKRFGVEVEISAKIANHGLSILEIPIRYEPRSRTDGKKIRVRDGMRALYLLLKFRIVNTNRRSPSEEP